MVFVYKHVASTNALIEGVQQDTAADSIQRKNLLNGMLTVLAIYVSVVQDDIILVDRTKQDCDP